MTRKIQHVCAFHENIGDILYNFIFKEIFTKNCKSFGICETSNIMNSNLDCGAIKDLDNKATTFIGGGAILRINSGSSAKGHCKLVNMNQHEFYNKYFTYKSNGPFILTNPDIIKNSIYMSVGHGGSLPNARDLSTPFNSCKYIYTRDEVTKNILKSKGVNKYIDVQPDLVTLISDVYKPEKYNFKNNKPVAIFQCNASNKNYTSKVKNLLKDFEVWLVPASFNHGDIVALQQIKKEIPECKYHKPSSIYETLSILSSADFVVATSMHFAIIAYSYNIPFYIFVIHDKIKGFLDVCNLKNNINPNKFKGYSELDESKYRTLEVVNKIKEFI